MECKITDAINTTGAQLTLLPLLFSPRLQILQRRHFLVVLLVFDDLPTVFASLTHGCRGGLRHFLTPIFHPLCFAELLLNFKPDCGPTLASYHLWLHCIRNTTEMNNNTPRNLATHTCTHPFNGPLSGTTWVSRYQKVKQIWILLKQETVSGNGNSWAICKSAPHSRLITTPAPHHSVFAGPDAPPVAQPTASKDWNLANLNKISNLNEKHMTNQT